MTVISALMITLAGCPARSGTEQPAFAQPPTDLPVSRIVLPFDAYRLGPHERGLLERAHRVMTERCMQARGLGQALRAMPPVRDDPPEHARRYGVAEEAVAHRYGYHYPSSAADDSRAAQLARWETTLSARELSALDGTTARPGCWTQATALLTPSPPQADLRWLETSNFRTVNESATHPTTLKAQTAWRMCMRQAGFDYTTPLAASSERRWKLDTRLITSQERATAVADVRCKHRSGLITAWLTAETVLQTAAITQHKDRFTRIGNYRRTQLARAQRLSTRQESRG